ncbi:unnamed protein product [Echinostoma caproni]|uniref:Uncharacterized protein n=1 Tax=Echinostoma caproni TaxID=27848 RepID=A0A183B0R6_9TREM|nr:unnamed protein product [Echinostoma caproni]
MRNGCKITGIPEDEVLEDVDVNPIEERPREPEADARDMVVEGLGLDSDEEEEIEEQSELEDNFVELAGGHALEDKDTDEAVNDSDRPRQINPRDVLGQDKVLMMERFLFGDNERDWSTMQETDSDEDSDDEQFDDPDDATILNRQFEKLMVRCKARSASASQSMVTGTSMMSEGLQFALTQDTRMLQQQ